ncbi:MAG: family 78 glycoside hydrolase catalytic domain [Planctomycetota bacterium]
MSDITSANWIWDTRVAGDHRYVCFRRDFRIASAGTAVLEIAADSDFVVWLNGCEIGRGQFSDWPQQRTFTTIAASAALHSGNNTLAVLVYHRGAEFSDHAAGQPGLIAALRCGDQVITTDAAWRCREHPAFRHGPMPRVSNQQGFTAEFDARRDVEWRWGKLRGRGWAAASVMAGATDGYWTSLEPRPVPSLLISPPMAIGFVAQGFFIRRREAASTALTIADDALVARRPWDVFAFAAPDFANNYQPGAPTHSDHCARPNAGGLDLAPLPSGFTGHYVIVDLGREESGLLHLRINAPAGTVLDIAHGEHLDDGRVRCAIDGRNFADRYICCAGLQEFTLPFRRLGARYLEVHIRAPRRGRMRLHYMGLVPTELPVTRTGDFACSDSLADRYHAIGVRTLQLCMHEHYEDTPWREQSLYAFDSRNQALCGYYAFGNYDFAAASFTLLGQGFRPDVGQLGLCAPARVLLADGSPLTIPIFSLAWIMAVSEHWLHSGSSMLYDRFAETITAIIEGYCSRQDKQTGLYRLPTGPGQWQFYDWEDGLSGTIGNDNPAGRIDAPYNLFLHEALGNYAWMLGQAGRADDALVVQRRQAALGRAIDRLFWDKKNQVYATFLQRSKQHHVAELVQAQALTSGIGTAARRRALLDAFGRSGVVPLTLSTRLYHLRGAMLTNPAGRRQVADNIAAAWGRMTLTGATSFWETPRGGDDFACAASLSHAWSALPVYYHQAWVLGVRPLTPGFRSFVINPYADRFAHAEGRIPTPAGPISIRWERTADGLELTASGPSACKPTLLSWPECPVRRATWNGRKLST